MLLHKCELPGEEAMVGRLLVWWMRQSGVTPVLQRYIHVLDSSDCLSTVITCIFHYDVIDPVVQSLTGIQVVDLIWFDAIHSGPSAGGVCA